MVHCMEFDIKYLKKYEYHCDEDYIYLIGISHLLNIIITFQTLVEKIEIVFLKSVW